MHLFYQNNNNKKMFWWAVRSNTTMVNIPTVDGYHRKRKTHINTKRTKNLWKIHEFTSKLFSMRFFPFSCFLSEAGFSKVDAINSVSKMIHLEASFSATIKE